MLLLLKACLKIVGNQDLCLRLFLKMEWRKVINSLDDFLCFNFIDEPLYEFRKLRSTEKFCLDNWDSIPTNRRICIWSSCGLPIDSDSKSELCLNYSSITLNWIHFLIWGFPTSKKVEKTFYFCGYESILLINLYNIKNDG